MHCQVKLLVSLGRVGADESMGVGRHALNVEDALHEIKETKDVALNTGNLFYLSQKS